MTHPGATTRAMVLVEPGRIEERRLPLPTLGDEDGLLRVEAVGICGTDVQQYRGRLPGVGAVTPVVPGHEIVGRIEAAGRRALRRWGVAVGDRVVLEEVLRCGRCPTCRQAGSRGCQQLRVYGITVSVDEPPGLWGGYADHVYLAPTLVLHRVPDGVSAEDAALVVPLANGIRWAGTVPGTRPGDTVVVLGPGQQGLGCVVGALRAGAAQVILTGRSRDRRRLEIGARLGAITVDVDADDAVPVVLERTGGRGADTVVDATAESTAPVVEAIDMVRHGGTVVLAGLKAGAAVPGFVSDHVVLKEVCIRGVGGHDGASIDAALELLASRHFPLHLLHSHTLSLAEAEQALRLVAREIPGEDPVHVILVP